MGTPTRLRYYRTPHPPPQSQSHAHAHHPTTAQTQAVSPFSSSESSQSPITKNKQNNNILINNSKVEMKDDKNLPSTASAFQLSSSSTSRRPFAVPHSTPSHSHSDSNPHSISVSISHSHSNSHYSAQQRGNPSDVNVNGNGNGSRSTSTSAQSSTSQSSSSLSSISTLSNVSSTSGGVSNFNTSNNSNNATPRVPNSISNNNSTTPTRNEENANSANNGIKRNPSYAKIVAKKTPNASPEKISITAGGGDGKKAAAVAAGQQEKEKEKEKEKEGDSTSKKKENTSNYRFPEFYNQSSPASFDFSSLPNIHHHREEEINNNETDDERINDDNHHYSYTDANLSKKRFLLPISPPSSEHQRSSPSYLQSMSGNILPASAASWQNSAFNSRTNSNTSSYNTDNSGYNNNNNDQYNQHHAFNDPFFNEQNESGNGNYPLFSSSVSPSKNNDDSLSNTLYQSSERGYHNPPLFSPSRFSPDHSRSITNTSNICSNSFGGNHEDSGNGKSFFSASTSSSSAANDHSFDYHPADLTGNTSISAFSDGAQQGNRDTSGKASLSPLKDLSASPSTEMNAAAARRARHASNISDTSLYSFDGLNDLSIFSPPFPTSTSIISNAPSIRNEEQNASGRTNNDDYLYNQQQLGRPVDVQYLHCQPRDRDEIPLPPLSLIPDLNLDGDGEVHEYVYRQRSPSGINEQLDHASRASSAFARQHDRLNSPQKQQSDLDRLYQRLNTQAGGNPSSDFTHSLPSAAAVAQAVSQFNRSVAAARPTTAGNPSQQQQQKSFPKEDPNFPNAVREAYERVKLLSRNEAQETRYLFVSGFPVPQDEESQCMVNEITEAIKIYGQLRGIYVRHLSYTGSLLLSFHDLRHAITCRNNILRDSKSNPAWEYRQLHADFIEREEVVKLAEGKFSTSFLSLGEGKLVLCAASTFRYDGLKAYFSALGDVKTFQLDTSALSSVETSKRTYFVEYYDDRCASKAWVDITQAENADLEIGWQDSASLNAHLVGEEAANTQYDLNKNKAVRPPLQPAFPTYPEDRFQRYKKTSWSELSNTPSPAASPLPDGFRSATAVPPSTPSSPTAPKTAAQQAGLSLAHLGYVPNDPAKNHVSNWGLIRDDPVPDNNLIRFDRIISGEDKRTSCILRNLPNRMTQLELMENLDQVVPREYDFVYLRVDFTTSSGCGYGFVNFTSSDALLRFWKARLGTFWDQDNSRKLCMGGMAAIQGKAALIERFRNSSVMDAREDYRPKIFYSSGPMRGLPEPFPLSNNALRKAKSTYATSVYGLYGNRPKGGFKHVVL